MPPNSQTIIISKNCSSNRKGLLSVKSRRQALKLCLDAVVVVVIEIFNELLFEAIHRLELLQIQKFTFKQAKEVSYYSIIRAVIFPTHALPYAFLTKHPPVLFVLVLPLLVGMKNRIGLIVSTTCCLKFRRIPLVWYSFWHSITAHLLDSISYCLTNGVQFKVR